MVITIYCLKHWRRYQFILAGVELDIFEFSLCTKKIAKIILYVACAVSFELVLGKFNITWKIEFVIKKKNITSHMQAGFTNLGLLTNKPLVITKIQNKNIKILFCHQTKSENPDTLRQVIDHMYYSHPSRWPLQRGRARRNTKTAINKKNTINFSLETLPELHWEIDRRKDEWFAYTLQRVSNKYGSERNEDSLLFDKFSNK